MRYVLLIAVVLLLFGTVACEKVDKAFDAVDKAKKLKTELEKTADEVKKDIVGKAEEVEKKVKKGVGNFDSLSAKDGKDSEHSDKSPKEGKGKGQAGREDKDDED